jgi:hypothetical protein
LRCVSIAPFRHAGRTAGVLQKGQIVSHDLRFNVLEPIAIVQRTTKRDGIRQVIFWHQTLDVLHHKVDHRPFGGGKLIAHARQNDVFYLRIIDHLFQRMGKVRYDHNGAAPLSLSWCSSSRGV